MPAPRSPQQIVDQEFLALRAKLLEVAATLDRIDRGEGPGACAERMCTVRTAIETLLRDDDNRAEQLQLLFSLPYDTHWRKKMEL